MRVLLQKTQKLSNLEKLQKIEVIFENKIYNMGGNSSTQRERSFYPMSAN